MQKTKPMSFDMSVQLNSKQWIRYSQASVSGARRGGNGFNHPQRRSNFFEARFSMAQGFITASFSSTNIDWDCPQSRSSIFTRLNSPLLSLLWRSALISLSMYDFVFVVILNCHRAPRSLIRCGSRIEREGDPSTAGQWEFHLIFFED